MKIVDRKTFLSLPPGTVYCKYDPYVIGELLIKGDTISDADWFYQDITTSLDVCNCGEFVEGLDASQKTDCEINFDFDCESRDGCFQEYQLFAVWSHQDVTALIDRLSRAIEVKS